MTLRLIGRDGGLSTLYQSCEFACQQTVLKTFSGAGYLRSKDGVVWLWHVLVNFYMWLTISFCYGSIPLTLGLIGKDSGLSTLCHSCRFACQQRVLILSLSRSKMKWWAIYTNLLVNAIVRLPQRETCIYAYKKDWRLLSKRNASTSHIISNRQPN